MVLEDLIRYYLVVSFCDGVVLALRGELEQSMSRLD